MTDSLLDYATFKFNIFYTYDSMTSCTYLPAGNKNNFLEETKNKSNKFLILVFCVFFLNKIA